MSFDFGFMNATKSALAQQHQIDILSNNLANADTAGFKRDRMVFDRYMQREVVTDFEQGPMKQTDNPLDLAIGGNGFFRVRTPDGIRLTRNGSFAMTATGALVTTEGYPVLGAGGAAINLNTDGPTPVIDAQGNIVQGTEQVGALDIVDVADTKNIWKEGGSRFSGLDGKAPQTTAARDFTLYQGTLEGSNIKVVDEMVDMISAFRAYESYTKCVQAMDQMDSKSVNQVGKVA